MDLSAIESLPPAKRLEEYAKLSEAVISDVEKSNQLIEHLLQASTTSSRPALAHHVESITRNIEAAQDVAYGALDVLKTRLVTFDEFDASIRDALASQFEADGDCLDAAKMLAQVNCESGRY